MDKILRKIHDILDYKEQLDDPEKVKECDELLDEIVNCSVIEDEKLQKFIRSTMEIGVLASDIKNIFDDAIKKREGMLTHDEAEMVTNTLQVMEKRAKHTKELASSVLKVL